ncbi:hypothetical protein PENSUB_5357 [Penicillium subrubescens]|uniref:Uncharacterized protein n=1 Tax=Penicillium subrubescens TaxID=1316194 RepID=A0A1Q5U9X5_9EURO|nr:hypothetical protein PENSUB_5357 [Penicillium subrubescens]
MNGKITTHAVQNTMKDRNGNKISCVMEEGNGKEVAEEHEGLLNQTCKEADRAVHDTDLEIAEATSLESEEIGI